MKTGIEQIAEERQHQIDEYGYTGWHHVQNPHWYDKRQLINAAQGLSQYIPDHPQNRLYRDMPPEGWDKERCQKMCDKPFKDRLVIAGALIAAELDRVVALEKHDTDQSGFHG